MSKNNILINKCKDGIQNYLYFYDLKMYKDELFALRDLIGTEELLILSKSLESSGGCSLMPQHGRIEIYNYIANYFKRENINKNIGDKDE